MNGDDLCFMSVSDLAPLLRSREISPVDLVNAHLARIDDLDDVLRAFIHVAAEEALEQARAAEAEIAAGGYRGALHGVTVAHKDIIDVAGMPTTGGSSAWPVRHPTEDATVQARLREAGAIVLGKLNLVEFASGSMGVYGFARNPWNLSAYPGGSSSGSGTALAAGMVTIATGTDTGGSVRNPASFCGLAGLRVTYGRVSRHGCIPLSWSQDSIGPMGRTVADVATMLGSIAGRDDRDPTSSAEAVPDYLAGLSEDLRGLRVGVPDSFYYQDLDPDVDAAMQAAVTLLAGLGADIVPVSLPASEFASAASWTIAYSESFAYHHDKFKGAARAYTPAFFHKIAAAGLTSAVERIVSQQIRQVVTREFAVAMRTVDVIVTPSSRVLASADSRSVPAESRTLAWGAEMTSVTRPVSLAGYPALSVPIGFARDGTPMGMQLVARPWEEATLLRTGHAYEVAAGWTSERPPAFPEVIPPRFGENAAVAHPTEPSTAAGVTPSWVADMARQLDYPFVTEADAAAIAPLLAPVKEQLRAAQEVLDLDLEPATRGAGWPWAPDV